MPVCASLGRSQRVRCGEVVDAIYSYTSSDGTQLWSQVRTNLCAVRPGDSGSPLYFVNLSETTLLGTGMLSTISDGDATCEPADRANFVFLPKINGITQYTVCIWGDPDC